MLTVANTIALASATARSDRTVAFSWHRTDRSFVQRLMHKAHGWFKHKPSVELAEVIGCDERTARRYFAGDRTPDAIALMSLLRSPYGVRLVQEATSTLPKKQYDEFWSEMAMAALRARLRDDLETANER